MEDFDKGVPNRFSNKDYKYRRFHFNIVDYQLLIDINKNETYFNNTWVYLYIVQIFILSLLKVFETKVRLPRLILHLVVQFYSI